jgi:hypothetical protein
MLSSCGTVVPNIQEIGDDAQGELLIKAIAGSVHCEIRNAIITVIGNDKKTSRIMESFTHHFYITGASR